MTQQPPPTRPARPAGRVYVSRAAGGGPISPPPGAAAGQHPLVVPALVAAIVFPPAGLVLGHLARAQIRRTGQAGASRAQTALIISYAWIGLWLLFVALTNGGRGGLAGWKAILLGVVEGVTEFLPVSSTGHLTIAEKLLHLKVDDVGVTAYTAIIQVGAIIAAIIYFRADIIRIVVGFVRGVRSAEGRRSPDWRLALYVIAGSVPVAVVGLGAKHLIEGGLRNLWVVAFALILWSAVMVVAERLARQDRDEATLTWTDAIVIGVAQCFALVPGVSRSGATISAGLLRQLDRVTATRLSFFLGIPALTAAGGLEAVSDAKQISSTVGWSATFIGIVVSFAVAYASIAWLLRYVAHHSIVTFVWYRVGLGVLLVAALATGGLAAK